MGVGKVDRPDASTGSRIKYAAQMLGISNRAEIKLAAKSEREQMMLEIYPNQPMLIAPVSTHSPKRSCSDWMEEPR